MRLLSILLVLFPLTSLAAKNLDFTDTKVNFTKDFDFQFLAESSSFISNPTEGRITVVRKTPEVMVNKLSVQKFWKKNLKAVGVSANDKDCREISKAKFLCEKKDKEKNHYLSWTKKDLIYVMTIGEKAEILKPSFDPMKDLK